MKGVSYMKKRLLSAALALTLAIGGFALPNGGISAVKAYAANTAASEPVVTASMASGKYDIFNGFDVKLSSDPDAMIFYSLNNTGYRLYSSPLYINHNSTINAYAIGKNGTSKRMTFSYELTPYIISSHESGVYSQPQRVYLLHATNGAKIYYTLDGSVPNENSELYTSSGVVIPRTCALKAVIVKPGCSKKYIIRDFIIENPLSEFEEQYANGGLVVKEEMSDSKTVNKLNDFKSKWGYNQLNDAQKQAYEAIFNAVKTHTESVDISSLKIRTSEIDKLYWAFDYDNPQFYALANGYGYSYYSSKGYVSSIALKYSRTLEQEQNLEASFLTNANEALNAAREYASDYDKLRSVHDWIINRTDYILTGPVYKSEADGPIIYGKALCEGYSKAFMYLVQSLGFDCVCVIGEANGGPHMWNMVKMNGTWYHVDVTFDDPIMSDGSKALTHDFFLLGTTEISKTHKLSTPFAVPYAPNNY